MVGSTRRGTGKNLLVATSFERERIKQQTGVIKRRTKSIRKEKEGEMSGEGIRGSEEEKSTADAAPKGRGASLKVIS